MHRRCPLNSRCPLFRASVKGRSTVCIYVKRKVRIRTILGFCCANLGSELCAIILGSRMQTSDPRICCANLGSPYFVAQSSDPHAIILDRATKSRPSADPRFAQQILGSDVCVRDPRIIAPKLGSEICAAKS